MNSKTKPQVNLYQKYLLNQQFQGNKSNSTLKTLLKQNKQSNKDQPSDRPSLTRPSLRSKNLAIEQITENLRSSIRKTPLKTEPDGNDFSFSQHENEIIKIQSMYRVYKAKKIVKQLEKKHQYRKSIINELIMTERIYFQDLQAVHLHASIPLHNDKIITDKDNKLLFGNLDAILELSKDFYQQLATIKFGPNTKVANLLYTMVPYFKIYFIYCNNYNYAVKTLNNLKKENKKFKQFLQNLEKTFLVQGIENYLIKPVQRLPKYVLLMKDFLKNTDEEHCDYKDIAKALDQFSKVNEENNKNMDKIIINSKMFELQKLYGSQIQILDSKREFKGEESLKMIWKKEIKPVIVYLLTDLIIVTERQMNTKKNEVNYVLLTAVELNENSFCKQLEDLDYVSNLFSLVGKNNTVTFIGINSEQRDKHINFLNELILNLSEKQNNRQEAIQKVQGDKFDASQSQTEFPVEVQIVGTQELSDGSHNYTQYIIQVDIMEIAQKIFLRYKQFTELQKLVQEKFPKLKLQYFKDQKLFSKHDSKVIESRKIHIMNFLQTMLNTKEIRTQGKEILDFIGLPENFYQLPSLLMNQNQQSIQSNSTFLRTERKTVENLKGSLYQSIEGIPVSPRQPVKALYHLKAQDQQLNHESVTTFQSSIISDGFGKRSASQQGNKKISAQKLIRTSGHEIGSKKNLLETNIKVALFMKGQEEKELTINPQTRAVNALEDIAIMINLKCAFDFKFYIEDRQQLRPLEDDEILWNLLISKKVEDKKIKQLFSKPTITNIWNGKALYLKKHIYVSNEEEKQLYEEDNVRAELLTQQILHDISQGILKLNQKEYTMFAALYLYLEDLKEIDEKNIPFNLLKKFLPSQIYKNISDEFWINFLPEMVNNFQLQVRELQKTSKEQEQSQQDQLVQQFIQNEQEQMPERRSSQLSPQLTESESNSDRLIAQLVLLDLIAQTQFYGMNIFQVQANEQSKIYLNEIAKDQWKQFQKSQKKSAQNIQGQQMPANGLLYFCIGYQNVQFYGNLTQHYPLLKFTYDQLEQIKTYPESIIIPLRYSNDDSEFQVKKTLEIRLKTSEHYYIRQLMEKYTELQSEMILTF